MFGISMYDVLLTLHVLGAISFLGPVTVCTSMFPKHATVEVLGIAQLFSHITRGYGLASIGVPVFGLLAADDVGYLGKGWVLASLAITLASILMLFAVIIPRQRMIVKGLEAGTAPSEGDLELLRRSAGIYALSWFVVLVLMIVKPA